MAVDLYDSEGELSYENISQSLFGKALTLKQVRHNSKWCISVPCFSKEVYAISFHIYSYDFCNLSEYMRYGTYSMGFDLLTTGGVVEGFRIRYELPSNLSKWSEINILHFGTQRRKQIGEVIENVDLMKKDLVSAKKHLIKFYGLTFAI